MLISDPPVQETALTLRGLYREAESRAARLRLLVEAGRALAGARGADLDRVAQQVARQAALLLGHADARIQEVGSAQAATDGTSVLPLIPSGGGRPVAELVLDRRIGGSDRTDPDDAEAVSVLRQLLAGALAARAREAHLQTLLSQLLVAQERERAHVARELHDGAAQVAAAALRRIELASTSRDPVDTTRALELQRMAVSELRRVIAGMRPTILDDLGLKPALEQLTAALAAEGFDARLSADLPTRLPPHLETGLFRLAQEASNNVRAHAGGPCRVDLDVVLRPDGGGLFLRVTDHGRGFDPEALPPPADGRDHVGLAFMAERVAALGGMFALESAPGRGTTVSATVPYP